MTRASRTVSRIIFGASSALHASLGSAMWKLLSQPAGLSQRSQGQVVSGAGLSDIDKACLQLPSAVIPFQILLLN